MLKDVPSLKGIFTMRHKNDADNFKRHVDPSKGKVVIVGGGLLGIELAASLREVDMDITIVQRISRLMDRQLDLLAQAFVKPLQQGTTASKVKSARVYVGSKFGWCLLQSF